jgi:hypothetical protein
MADQHMSRAQQRARNLAIAAVAGQAGCASLVIIMAALFAGMWLDNRLGQRGPCTIGLLVLSVPLSLIVMLKIALVMIARIIPQPPTDSSEKEKADP